jgi:signal transduction histidine kinase/ligand-binding sensor domain-containing protein
MKFFIFSIGLFISIFSFASNQFDDFISFNTGNGKLSHNTVEAIARDSFGYVWIGTNYGLNRLDGYQTQNFLFDPNNPNSISSNIIKAIYVDSENEVWVGTIGGGLNKFDRKTNNFIRFLPPDSPENISTKSISAITEDKKGNIWIGTIGNGVNRYDKKTGQFKKFDLEKYDPEHRTNSTINELFCDIDGNIWVGLNQSEVFKIDPSTEIITFHGLIKGEEGYSDVGAIKGIDQLRNGTLLFSTWSGNLYKLRPLADKKISLFIDNGFFGKNSFTDIVIDREDKIWISTWEKGLYKISYDKKEKELFQQNQFKMNSIGSNSINLLYLDGDDNLWVGFTDNGLSLLSLQKKFFKTLLFKSQTSTFPEKYNAYSITRDKGNTLWIGSRGQGLVKHNLKTKETVTFSSQKYTGLKSNSILTLKISPDNKIWVGTDGGFLSLFDPVNEQFTHIENLIDDWSGAVFCIAENEQYVWCGTWGGGIKKIDKKTLKYSSINFDDKDQFRNTVFDLELRDSILWVANIGIGLIKFNIHSGIKKIYSPENGYPKFPKERIIDIAFESDSVCWLSTDGAGLFRFNPLLEKLENYYTKYPQTGNFLQSTVTDTEGNLWTASISGVSCIDKKTGKCYNFDKNNGLINNQLNKSAIFFDSIDNLIYTGGVEGVNYFNPKEIIIDSTSKKVAITDLKVMGKSIITGSKYTSLPINITDNIHLFPKDKVITIHFSSFEFQPSLKNKYEYMLEGFDENWNETPYSKNFIQYTNLYPGTYFFKVRPYNNDGVLSNDMTTLKINVHPAFWQTLFFKIALLIVLLFIGFLYFKNRYEALITAKLLLEKKVVERTTEIQQQKEKIEHQNHLLEQANRSKDKFFSIISHDLRNPVTTIDQLSNLIISQQGQVSEEKMMSYFRLLKKTSTSTLELLDDLLIWARTQTNRIEIKRTSLRVQDILDHVINICRPFAEKKNIEIITPLPTSLIVNADKYSIETTLRNLITNAIKFSNPYSSVTISLEEDSEKVIFHITDTGIGMKEEEIKKLFKIEKMHSKQGTSGESGSGLGLVLCHEFLTLNGGTIWVKSKLGEGSTFSFSLQKA